MPSCLHLYLDDSGTRNPDKKPSPNQRRDWFGLGGILVREEDEEECRRLYQVFCDRWRINYPLHSVDIRSKARDFSWLDRLSQEEFDAFMSDLSGVLLSIPALGHACVIDRPGYNERYTKKYGRQKWLLCKTAFDVLVERAAKHAIAEGRKLRVYPERGDKTSDARVRGYYEELRTVGLPFDPNISSKYTPLTQQQLADTLYDLKFKLKSSPMAQLADLYLYPICRGGYEANYRPYTMLREKQKLVDDVLPPADAAVRGIKYSCFELVHAAKSGPQKAQEPGFPQLQASLHAETS